MHFSELLFLIYFAISLNQNAPLKNTYKTCLDILLSLVQLHLNIFFFLFFLNCDLNGLLTLMLLQTCLSFFC